MQNPKTEGFPVREGSESKRFSKTRTLTVQKTSTVNRVKLEPLICLLDRILIEVFFVDLRGF